MANWYRAGTVSVNTNGTVVTGAGTDFVSNVLPGEGILLADGRVHEVASIQSATQLTIVDPYVGGNVTGSLYAVFPTTGIDKTLVDGVQDILNTFGAVRDGVGNGLFPDGTVSVPGIRFSADQDTGIFRASSNRLAIATGGINRFSIDTNGDAFFYRYVNVNGSISTGGWYSIGIPTVVANVPAFTFYTQNSSYHLGGIACTLEVAAPVAAGISFNVHKQNTGVIEAGRFNHLGNFGIGVTNPLTKVHVGGTRPIQLNTSTGNVHTWGNAGGGWEIGYFFAGSSGTHKGGFGAYGDSDTLHYHYIGPGYASPVNLRVYTDRIYLGGNLNVGDANGNAYHKIVKNVTVVPNQILAIGFQDGETAKFYSANGTVANAAATNFWLNANNTTGRSINAGGTINASGADYAEYMRKAPGCGDIAKGDICGVDRNSELTRKWADAVSFVVKSTDPSYVGGDRWGDNLGVRPTAPTEPVAPILMSEDLEDSEKVATYEAARRKYETELTAYDADFAKYNSDLAAFEAALEAERQKVDRIAFSGQVPINLDEATLATCEAALAADKGVYIIAAPNHGGIKGIAVLEDDMTLPQYMKRIAKVWAVRDGQAWGDVQHG